jgi:hypothetical protein
VNGDRKKSHGKEGDEEIDVVIEKQETGYARDRESTGNDVMGGES